MLMGEFADSGANWIQMDVPQLLIEFFVSKNDVTAKSQLPELPLVKTFLSVKTVAYIG